MPIAISIDAKKGIVSTFIEGRASTDEIVDALKNIMKHPDYRLDLRGIVDMRTSGLDTRSTDVRRIADLLIECRDRVGWSKSAVVVSRNVTFGMTRMFQVFCEASSVEVEIFRDMDEARRWLEKEK